MSGSSEFNEITMDKPRYRHAKVPLRPLIVDRENDRRTVPTSLGKQLPVLFGSGATSALMYIALNPGCGTAELRAALEISQGAARARIVRLRSMGLVVGIHRLQINTGLMHKAEFVRFLREYGKVCGLSQSPPRLWVRDDRRNVPISTTMPKNLFGTPNRTSVLLFMAVMHETYMKEISDVLKIRHWNVTLLLRELAVEGVLRRRMVHSLKVYSLDLTHPVAEFLRVLLMRVAGEREDIRGAAVNAYVRREKRRREGALGETRVFDDLENASQHLQSIPGVEKIIGYRVWRMQNGLRDYRALVHLLSRTRARRQRNASEPGAR
jgi:DNA-binding MarR family transcriptional regulator